MKTALLTRLCRYSPVQSAVTVLPESSTSASSGSHKGALIGGIIGGVLALILLVGAATFFIIRRMRRNAQASLPVSVSLANLKSGAATIDGRAADAKSIRTTHSVTSFDLDKKVPLEHQ